MGDLILAIDQSTSGTKAVLFDRRGRLVDRYTVGHRQYYPQPGWVEHDPEEIYGNTLAAIKGVMRQSGAGNCGIAALALTNQRETVLLWERSTGKPIHRAVVWQCRRGEEICRRLRRDGCADTIRERTGLVLSPYFSAAKAKWILDNIPAAKRKKDRGDLLFGTIDTWLLWNLTGGKVHATDYSNASRTQLFNLEKLAWDDDLLRLFGLDASMMPEVGASDRVFGHTGSGLVDDRVIPISGLMGDSHAALFGQQCWVRGMAKATYGTGSSVMINIGPRPKLSAQGLVASVAWGLTGGVEYVLEGNLNCTGDTIKWLVEEVQILPNAAASETVAASVPDNGGVYLVPAFVGLGAPYWDSEARATISGLTRDSTKAHLVRAALESIAYQIKDIADLMAGEAGVELMELRVDGGPTRNDWLMQFQADLLDAPVVRAGIEELSALGAAFAAGLAVGFWADRCEIEGLRQVERTFTPQMEAKERDRLYRGWKSAVGRTLTKRSVRS